ncbi:MAG: hypothetical protein GDA48_03910 [Hormoscilla sp. GM102CHS1]|nr:hypothetical protein [Hormoscilla sp. GM102CHS1]
MDASNTLEQRVLEIQKLPRGSNKRRLAVNRVISDLQRSDKLFCQGRFNYPHEVYDEALKESLLYISQKIDEYDQTIAKVTTWVNRILEFKFKDAIKKYNKRLELSLKELSLDAPVGNDFDTPLSEMIAQPDAKSILSDRVWDYIFNDRDGLFAQKHVKGHPRANYRSIALLVLEGHCWKDVAVAVGMPDRKWSTVQSFY